MSVAVENVLGRLERVKRNGTGWMARCPAHEDRKPSLAISEGNDGRALLYCHAGCQTAAILGALGLSEADLFEARNGASSSEIVATYPYVDEAGELLFEAVRYEPKDFRQRRPDGTGGWIWNLKGVPRVLYRLPAVLAAVEAGEPVVLVEGEKDVEALERAGVVATCNPMGAGKWSTEYAETLRGADVIVVPDLDREGLRHALDVVRSLEGKAASVEIRAPMQGKDISDHLAAGYDLADLERWGIEELERWAAETDAEDEPAAATEQPFETGTPPAATWLEREREIVASGRPLRDVTADALAALERANDPPSLFVRGGTLARVRRDEHGRLLIDTLGAPEVRGALERAARWTRINRKGEAFTVPPPREVVDDVRALGEWAFPALVGVTEAPTIRADGSILDRPGYDSATGLLCALSGELSVAAIPARPRAAEVRKAVGLIEETFADFPFVDDASRANAIGLFMTAIVRPAIDGLIPLALVDSTQMGSGKGLLVNVVSMVAAGRPASLIAAPDREEEWAKTIGASLMEAPVLVAIDEADILRSRTLAAALTSHIYKTRVLGYSTMIEVPQRATWAATGNNIKLGGDLARRCYWIRLDAKTARPWKRTGFRHEPLLEWVRAERGVLIAAALTLARAWYADDCCPAPVTTIGMYEPWARTLGGILAHAGITGFLDNLDALYDQADEESSEWERFLRAWHAGYGTAPVTVAELYDDMTSQLLNSKPDLRDALPSDLANGLDKGAASFKARLGKAFGKRDGRRHGDDGIRVERCGQDARSSISSWQVEVGQ